MQLLQQDPANAMLNIENYVWYALVSQTSLSTLLPTLPTTHSFHDSDSHY